VCGVHFPIIGVIFISNGEDKESKEVQELESHDAESRNKKQSSKSDHKSEGELNALSQ